MSRRRLWIISFLTEETSGCSGIRQTWKVFARNATIRKPEAGCDAFYTKKNYGGNHRNMSVEEEEDILQQFRERAEAGQVVGAKEIKQAFDEKLGRDTGRGYIYMVLDRHKWRKVMPRSRHPKEADDEEITATKKLKA